MTRAFLPAAAMIALLLALPAPSLLADTVSVQRGRYLMGTLCTAVVEAADSATASAAAEAALDEIARLEGVMSSWRPDSELSRFNAAAPRPFDCTPDLFAVLDSARALAMATGGAFEPTIDPLNVAWDMRGRGRVPGDAERAEALARVDWRGLALEADTRRARLARAGMAVDLGGIGKGFALDRAGARLIAAGGTRALLNLGGELLALGAHWPVEVAHPNDRLRPVARLRVGAAAVSTSAQSERGVEVGGRRYGHVLDPSTGAPLARAGSVTVIARSATRADALSTALLVMGRDRAGDYARAHPDIGVLWLEPAGASLRAWRWNLDDVGIAEDSTISWTSD